MSDVLIKGMEIPKACSWFDKEGKFHACRFDFACVCSITGDNVATSFERRHPSCPLVEVEQAPFLEDARSAYLSGHNLYIQIEKESSGN